MTKTLAGVLALALAVDSVPEPGLRLETETTVSLNVRDRNLPRFPLWAQGAARARWSLTGDASRNELLDPLGPLPAGTVVLRQGGSLLTRVVLPDHRYFRLSLSALGAPVVEVVAVSRDPRPFDYLGVTCAAVHATMVLAAPPGAHERGWFPPELGMSADIWTTDALAARPELLGALVEMLGVPGMDDARLRAEVSLPLKVVVRLTGRVSGTLAVTVTSFERSDVPDSELDLPGDATEIPSPLSPVAIIGQTVPAR